MEKVKRRSGKATTALRMTTDQLCLSTRSPNYSRNDRGQQSVSGVAGQEVEFKGLRQTVRII